MVYIAMSIEGAQKLSSLAVLTALETQGFHL